jgi:hypothetical protein
MNCKPGDLAIIVGTSDYAGKLVEVLYAAPRDRFALPDGYPHQPCADGQWVVKILGSPVRAPTAWGKFRLTHYAAGRDEKLRPIRPDEETSATRETEAA